MKTSNWPMKLFSFSGNSGGCEIAEYRSSCKINLSDVLLLYGSLNLAAKFIG